MGHTDRMSAKQKDTAFLLLVAALGVALSLAFAAGYVSTLQGWACFGAALAVALYRELAAPVAVTLPEQTPARLVARTRR